MRKHFFRAAALAAPVILITGLALTAGPAGATTAATPSTTGTTIATTNAAGYEASLRNFRYISSTLTVPDTSFLTGIYPQEYIQLSNGSLTQVSGGGDQYVRAGIEACVVAQSFGATCSTGTWVAYVEAFDNSLSGPYFSHFYNLAGVNQGDGVNFSIYFDQAGNELHFTITPPPTSGTEQFYKAQAYGPLFDHAAALDDFTDSTGTPIPLPFFLHQFRVNQFLQAALTTYSGARGSLAGPWTTREVIATSNGLPYPSGTVRISPNALYADGLAANGAVRASDAFGVWAR